jgi:hypothetical protein
MGRYRQPGAGFGVPARELCCHGRREIACLKVCSRRETFTDEYSDHHTIQAPIERPLTVLLDGKEVATLWTLGASAEWLVLGYL